MRKLLAVVVMLSVVVGGLALWNNTSAEAVAKDKDKVSGKNLGPFPHIHQAINHLKMAKADMLKAKPIFHGHREKAIKLTDAAIKQLYLALKDNDRTKGKGKNK